MDHETSMCSAAGKWIAAPSTSPTTCGGISLRHGGDQRMGHPRHVRAGPRSGAAVEQPIRPQAAFLGSAQRRARAGDRPRPQHQLVFELRPAHDPTKAYGFVNCVVSLENLSSSIWLWYRDGDKWAIQKIIEIPAEPADPEQLSPASRTSRLSAARYRHRPVGRRQPGKYASIIGRNCRAMRCAWKATG